MTCKDIKEMVEEISNINDISVKTKTRYLADMRFVYCKLCLVFIKKLEYPSLSKIGKYIDRCHASVIHGVKQFDSLYKTQSFHGNEIFETCYNKLEIKFKIDKRDIQGLVLEKDVKRHYRIKHIVMQEKYRAVINKLSYKLAQYRKEEKLKKAS